MDATNLRKEEGFVPITTIWRLRTAVLEIVNRPVSCDPKIQLHFSARWCSLEGSGASVRRLVMATAKATTTGFKNMVILKQRCLFEPE